MDTFNLSGRNRPKSPPAQAAFSLVEVALAMGIFTFAFIAIFGLIPVGMTTFKSAMDASIESQICQRVINDVQQTDFTTLTGASTSYTNQPQRYFDEQGIERPNSANAIYHVNTVVYPMTTLPNGAIFSQLATVAVQIVHNPANISPKINPATGLWEDSRLTISSYPAFLSRNK